MGLVFRVSSVNQPLSASSTVRPKRLRYTAPTSSSSYVRPTAEIIAGMQRLAVEQRRLLGPRAPWHVGDIAWGLWQHEGREHEWEFRHWDDQAWAWLRLDKGTLDYDVDSRHPELLDAILDEPRARTAHAFEDDEET